MSSQACIKCKFMDCVESARSTASEGENMLVIHPDECIDCGVCEPECPPEAIKADTERLGSGGLNADYAKVAEHHPAQSRSGRRQRVGRRNNKFEITFLKNPGFGS